MVYCFSLKAFIRFVVTVLIETYVNICHCIIFLHRTPSKVREFSNNSIEPGISASGEKLQGVCYEFHFSDVYRSVNYTGLLAKSM